MDNQDKLSSKNIDKNKMSSNNRSFVFGAAILSIAGLIAKILGAIYRIPLANIVGVAGMSYYEVSFPYYSWLLVVSSSGLPTAISKLVSERATRGNFSGARKVFETAYKMLVVIGLFTTVVMYFLSDGLATMSGLPAAAMSFRALAPALFIVSIMCAYRGYLQGLQHMEGTAVSQVTEQVVKCIIGYFLAKKLSVYGPEYASVGALVGVSFSELVALIVIVIMYKKREKEIILKIKYEQSFKKERGVFIAKSLMSLAVPITIGASIMPLTGIADSAMIMNTLTTIGFTPEIAQQAYGILRTNVTTFINIPAVLTMALAMSLVPTISGAIAQKKKQRMLNAVSTGLKLSIMIGAPSCVGLFLLGKPIIAMLFRYLSPEQLSLADDLMHTASVGVLFLSVVQASTGILQGLGKPQIPVLNLMFGGLLKLITMFILMRIPSVNIQGASISTVVCFASAAAMDVIFLVRKTGLKFNVFNFIIKPVLGSVIMGAGVSIIYNLIGAKHPNVATMAAVIVGMALYFMMIFVLKMLSREELNFLPGGKRLAKLLYGAEGKK